MNATNPVQALPAHKKGRVEARVIDQAKALCTNKEDANLNPRTDRKPMSVVMV
jgi:hypothetical protein